MPVPLTPATRITVGPDGARLSERSVCVLTHVPEPLLARVPVEVPGARVQQIPEQGDLSPEVEGEVLLTQAWGSPNLREVVSRGVRWVHAYGTGVDAFPFDFLHPAIPDRAVSLAQWVGRTLERTPLVRWLAGSCFIHVRVPTDRPAPVGAG